MQRCLDRAFRNYVGGRRRSRTANTSKKALIREPPSFSLRFSLRDMDLVFSGIIHAVRYDVLAVHHILYYLYSERSNKSIFVCLL